MKKILLFSILFCTVVLLQAQDMSDFVSFTISGCIDPRAAANDSYTFKGSTAGACNRCYENAAGDKSIIARDVFSNIEWSVKGAGCSAAGSVIGITGGNSSACSLTQAQFNMIAASSCVMSSAVVPVELMVFSGKAMEASIDLQWRTASEDQNKGFEIEYSTNGKDWKQIGFVAGNGTTIEVNDYAFTHSTPTVGDNYYQLKQIDEDGSFEYSDIVVVEWSDKTIEDIKVFPNPATQSLNYQVSDMDAVRSVQLFDVFGKLVKVATRIDGQLLLEDLNAGMYVLVVETRTTQLREIVVKQ